jgi:hypothetical protein
MNLHHLMVFMLLVVH